MQSIETDAYANKKRKWNFHSASVFYQSVLESVFSFYNPRARETEREAENVSEEEEGEEEGQKTLLSPSQSGAGVYRGELRWREGRERVQVVQQVPVQCCPAWVPVEVVRGGAGGQQLPVQHHGVES